MGRSVTGVVSFQKVLKEIISLKKYWSFEPIWSNGYFRVYDSFWNKRGMEVIITLYKSQFRMEDLQLFTINFSKKFSVEKKFWLIVMDLLSMNLSSIKPHNMFSD